MKIQLKKNRGSEIRLFFYFIAMINVNYKMVFLALPVLQIVKIMIFAEGMYLLFLKKGQKAVSILTGYAAVLVFLEVLNYLLNRQGIAWSVWFSNLFNLLDYFMFYSVISYQYEKNHAAVIRVFKTAAAFLIGYSFFLYYALPETATFLDKGERIFTGLANNRNQYVTYFLSFHIFNMLDVQKKGKWGLWDSLFEILGIITTLMTQSTTALIILAVLTVLTALYKFQLFPYRIKPKMVYASVGVIWIFLVLQNNLSLRELIAEIFHRDITFNSRIFLWQLALKRISARPLTGYGNFCLYNLRDILGISTVDNGILYLLLSTGMIGLLVWFWYFWRLQSGGWKRSDGGILEIGIVLCLIRSLSESYLSYSSILFWILLLFLYIDNRRADQTRGRKRE